MAKGWMNGQAAKFAKQVELGRKYYVVREQSRHAASYGDKFLYAVHVFTKRSLLTGQPMTDGGTSALALCRNQGPVYDTPPKGMDDIADKGRHMKYAPPGATGQRFGG